jgi:diguanylate cyclase (GGDEF)-like protein/PAS domain S-box-containing protein
MPPVLRKLLIMLVGAVATAVTLVVVVEAERMFPLPDVPELARAYWQAAAHPNAVTDMTHQLLAQARFYLFMLHAQWLLWLIPAGGAAMTLLFMRQVANEETAVYLERIHDQERQIESLTGSGQSGAGKWDAAREALDKLLDGGSDIWLVVGRDGRISRGNRAAQQLLQVEQLGGQELQVVLPWLKTSPLYGGLARVMKGETWREDIETPAGDGKRYWQALAWPWGGELAILLRDISTQFADASLLQNAEALVRQVVEESQRPIAVLDRQGVYLYVSPKFTELVGVPDLKRGESHIQKVPSFPPELAVVMQKLDAGEVVGNDAEHLTVNGREEILSWHLRAWLDAFGRPGGYILTAGNHTELHRLRAQTAEAGGRENALAYSDTLTGLPNRQLFNDRLNMALAVAHRQLGKLALLFLDLDGFKKVNDTLGHDAGDLLLKQVAARIQAQVRATDTVARLGGDEFTIILAIRDRADAEQVAEKLLSAIRAPYNLNGQEAHVGTSIGIALFPQDGGQAAELVRKADAAMYESKQAGKNTYRFATKQIVVQS